MPLKAKPKIPNETKQIADVVGLSVLSDQKIQMDGVLTYRTSPVDEANLLNSDSDRTLA